MTDNTETNPDLIYATGQDPHNAILNVEKQADLGMVTSGANPSLSAGVQGGWVGVNTSETATVPGAFSKDPGFTQGTTSGTVGGTGEDPTGAGDVQPIGADGGYGTHKEPPADDTLATRLI